MRDKQDAADLILASALTARYIIQCCTAEEAKYLADFFATLSSQLGLICRYPDVFRAQGGSGGKQG